MSFFKVEIRKSDGRNWIQYSRRPFPGEFTVRDEGLLRPGTWRPPHLRRNEMRDEWVSISASRQDRPLLPPKEYCPLCPHPPAASADGTLFKTEIPMTDRTYEWAVFENMYPSLALEPEGIGTAEVVLYSPDHAGTLGSQDVAHIEGLVRVWQDRSRSLGARPEIDNVFIFENKGAEIGVTLHHPHGQIYAFNHLPPFVAREVNAAHRHHAATGRCLICDLAARERTEGKRVVLECERMIAYVPHAARYPYEVHIMPKAHRPLIENLDADETRAFALMLKRLIHKYDGLFGFSMPYVMAMHQGSSKAPDEPAYHWHVEFYPPYRSKTKLKFLAGVESGTGFFVNDTIPEEKAAELRAVPVPF